MKNTITSNYCNEAKKQILITILFLGYLLFSSCSNSKPDANNKEKNPFESAPALVRVFTQQEFPSQQSLPLWGL